MSDQQEHGAGGSTRGRAILAWIVAPLVGIAFFPTILLLVIGMAPSIVAFFIDRRPRKVTARAIGYLNFAGCLPYAIKLWTGQNTISGVLSLVGEPSALMVMYSCAAVGWMLSFIMAPIMSAYLAVQHEARGRSISKRQEDLIKEWGSEVKGQAGVEQQPAPAQGQPQDAAPVDGGEGLPGLPDEDAEEGAEERADAAP